MNCEDLTKWYPNSASNRRKNRMILLFEEHMVEHNGKINLKDHDFCIAKDILSEWIKVGFVSIHRNRDFPDDGYPRVGFIGEMSNYSHLLHFSPEAWEMAFLCRKFKSGQMSLPSIVTHERTKIREDKVGRYVAEHEGFGNVQISRCSVTPPQPLYAQNFKHGSYMCIRVSRSETKRDGEDERYYARDMLLEFSMSETQWAKLLSSYNLGGGVPCTINYTEKSGKAPTVPYQPSVVAYEHELSDKFEKLHELIAKTSSLTEELSSGKTISKKQFAGLKDLVYKLNLELEHNLPYLKSSFAEAMSKTVDTAEREIQAKIDAAYVTLGKKCMDYEHPEGEMLELPYTLKGEDE